MIDYLALALTHGLLLVALVKLARGGEVRDDGALDPLPRDASETRREARARRRSKPAADA